MVKGPACPMSWMKLFFGLITLLATHVTALAGNMPKWTYEGPYGPQNWGIIAPEFSTCAQGFQQSPIDLTDPVGTMLAPVELHWKPADWILINNGRTLQATSKSGGHIIIDGTRYELRQFNFHTPSEHTIHGERFPMEAQFVHVSNDDEIAVIAIMMIGGGRNPAFESVMARAPVHKNDPSTLGGFNAARLAPHIEGLLRYQGSLTTPPCSETVLWTVLTEPVTISSAALTTFEILFENNARPIQPLNRRYVLSGSQ